MEKKVWWGGERIPASQAPGGHCEDAPCCGCCGPGSDDPAYAEPHEPDPDDGQHYGAYDDRPEDDYEDELYVGDPRRCPRHPEQVTSSPDGMYDSPCPACEAEMDALPPEEGPHCPDCGEPGERRGHQACQYPS